MKRRHQPKMRLARKWPNRRQDLNHRRANPKWPDGKAILGINWNPGVPASARRKP